MTDARGAAVERVVAGWPLCQCPFEFSRHECAHMCMARCVNEVDLYGLLADSGYQEVDAFQDVSQFLDIGIVDHCYLYSQFFKFDMWLVVCLSAHTTYTDVVRIVIEELKSVAEVLAYLCG